MIIVTSEEMVQLREIICYNGEIFDKKIKNNSLIEVSAIDKCKNGYADSFDYPGMSKKELVNIAVQNAANINGYSAIHSNVDKKILKYYDKCNINWKELRELIEFLSYYIDSRKYNYANYEICLKVLRMEKVKESELYLEEISLLRYELYVFFSTKRLFDDCKVHYFIDGTINEVFANRMKIMKEIDLLFVQFIDKCIGKYLPNKKYVCLIDSCFTGILTHEAVGHLAEADVYYSTKVSKDYEKQAYNSAINIIDYACFRNQIYLPSPVYIDKQGSIAKNVYIVKNGKYKEKMHSIETAELCKGKLTGNALSVCSKSILIRMRNTIFETGTIAKREMINSIENGIYLIIPGKGVSNKYGNFVIEIVLGYIIKNGKICNAIKNSVVFGNVFEFLKSITMVGNEMKITGAFCKKGKEIYVGMGGPALKCELNLK